MKIVFTGGGTGGHFYPIIAVAEELRKIVAEQKIVEPQLFFISPDPYNKNLLIDNNIVYKKVTSGKYRRYFSFLNFVDFVKIFLGLLKALWTLFWIYPDVVFSKGGFGSVPVTIAARILGIPVVIHESDTKPGKANLLASKFAKKIAISNPESSEYFKNQDAVALTGVPIRKDLLFKKDKFEGSKYFGIDPNVPTISILGGSQGAKRINATVIEILNDLLSRYQVIHVTGKDNYNSVKQTTEEVLSSNKHKGNYILRDYLDAEGMIHMAGASNLIVTRAGSTAISEIANWQVPSIVIPIPVEVSHDQRFNAFSYARKGACIVIEENNLTSKILYTEIERLFSTPRALESMVEGTKQFSKPDSARIIAKEILEIVLEHEK
jgi:UDP-N-acetylglucosamine--N-acetylmuramyl-(pentapeptide) pyrophosphoryl-undecaprenol N-acetylglucosamine transferase